MQRRLGRTWPMWLEVAAALSLALPAAAQPTPSRPSNFHPVRDAVSRVVPTLVPPRGCTQDVILLAKTEGVVPDVRGCAAGEVSTPLQGTLGLPLTGKKTPSGPVLQQHPRPGAPLNAGGGFTLVTPTAGSAPRTGERSGLGVAPTGQGGGDPTSIPRPWPPKGPPVLPPQGTPVDAGPVAPTDYGPKTGEEPSPPSSISGVPPGAVDPRSKSRLGDQGDRKKLSNRGPPNRPSGDGRVASAGKPDKGATRPPASPPLARVVFDWFWDGLNPLIVPAIAAVGLVGWRFWPQPAPPPQVSVKVRYARGALRFTDPGRAVLSAPRVSCSLAPGPPVLPGPLPILDIRTAP